MDTKIRKVDLNENKSQFYIDNCFQLCYYKFTTDKTYIIII